MVFKSSSLLWSSAVTLFLSSVFNNSNFFVSADLRDEIQFDFHSVKMPFPVSDIMASYVPGENGDEDGFIIITGGCNAPKGNERVNFGGDDLFACLSTSKATLKFDPFSNTFQEMASAPHERQRHAAVVMKGEVFVFGGRDSNDELVTAIDSFNPKTSTWTTRGALPDDVVTSDLTAWVWENYIYITGGFEANYTALGNTYRLDMTATSTADLPTDFASMGYEQVSPLPTPRGDFHAVVEYGYAYLAGGITHENDWCVAMRTTERYHMATDTWETLPGLPVGRADMAVAVLNGKVVAVGGETKPEGCKEVSDPAYGSFPANHVDVLWNQKWFSFEAFKDERFRFAAAVVPAQNKIYTFGGQLPFDFTCDCFPTSDDVGVGTESFEPGEFGVPLNEEEDDGLSTGAIAGIVIAGLVGVVIGVVVMKMCLGGQKEVDTGA